MSEAYFNITSLPALTERNISLTTIPYLSLFTSPTIVGHVEGRLYYDNVWKTLSLDMDTDVTLQIGQEDLRMVYNATGVTIKNGEAVYTNGVYSGGSNDVVTVAPAKADSPVTSAVLGIATQNIPNASYGFICVRGHVNDLDTNEIGRAYLQTQNMFFSARVGGTGGNSYSVQVINSGSGGLSYVEPAGVIVIDLGGTTPTVANIVTMMMTTTPSAFVKVKATGTGLESVAVAGVLPLANGVNTIAGQDLYLSAVDSGFLTTVIPSAPNLEIRVGRLITKSATVGRINVRLIISSRVDQLSDVTVASAIQGDRLTYNAPTFSWVNSPASVTTYTVLADIKTALGTQGHLASCAETSTIYRYETDGTAPVNYGATDDQYVLITGNGGVTRWIGVSGTYTYNQKSATFITNKLIAGTDTTVYPITGPTTLDATYGSQVLLDIQTSNQNITLPTAGNSKESQFLTITVVGTSAYSADIQTTNTNMNQHLVVPPDTSAFFMFGMSKWHLIGGKNAVQQLAQYGDSIYKTIQDWSNIVQSAGVISGGVCTDDSLGGVNVSPIKAIVKVTNSDIGGTAFLDFAGTHILAGALTDNSTNYIYFDYNLGSPTWGVTTDRLTLNRTTQFVVAQLFKKGLDLEIINLESTISNFSKKVVNRLIEVNGVNRVSGAVVSESGTRSLHTNGGVMYYGVERIITPGRDTNVSDTFDLYWRNPSGGFHTVKGETVIDRLRYDNNNPPVLNIGGGVIGTSNHGGLVKVETAAIHGLTSKDYVYIYGVTGTTEANGTWKVTVIDTTHFDLVGSAYVNAWVSGGTVDALPVAGISGGNYGVMWVFVCTEGDLYVLYGQGDYASSSAAEAATIPASLPPYMLFNTVLAAKVIVQPATANFYKVISAYTTPIGISIPTTHNTLGGLDGGAPGEYYHLTAAEHTSIVSLGGITTGGFGRVALYDTSPTGKVLADNIPDTDASNSIIVDIASHSLSANRIYTIPNAGADASFVMTELAQTVNGVKYLTSGVKTPFIFPNADSTNAVEIRRADGSTPIVSVDTTNRVLQVHGTGASTITALPNTVFNGWDTINDYLQANIQNLSSGDKAISTWVATADNGNDSTNFMAMGIFGSGFTGYPAFWPPGGWTISGPDSGFVIASDGELVIGTTNNSVPKAIKFFTANPLLANQKGMITGDGKWSNGAHTPTAWMHLKASGASTAGTAPLKFTGGLALSALEDGAMEYDGSHLYFTVGAVKYTLDDRQAANANLSSLSGLAYASASFVKMTGANTFTLDTTAYQTQAANLTSISGLTYASASFVKMTGAGTFTLDTATYLTSLSGAVLTSQTSPQTIGSTTDRLAKLWATDITCTNAIAGSVTGNAGTVTGLSVTAGKTLTVSNTLTLLGTDSSSLNIGTGGTLGTAAYTASTAYQPVATNLTSLAGLTYAAASFVKMTGAGTFALDTATYLTSLSGAVLTSQTSPQTIGSTTDRLAKLWATDITCTNAIAGSITTASNLAGGNSTTLLGSIPYQSNTDTTTLLAPNTTTTKKFFSQTGTGVNGAIPAWSTVTATDIGLSNVTNDAQVKASIGTTKGDLITFSAASTPIRLGAGASPGNLRTDGSGNWSIDTTSYQAVNTNLTSLAGLAYASASFVKMTGAGTFTLDTATYLTSLSGAVLTSQTSPQTIGSTTDRLAKLWATDITCTNTITGSVTGNAGTVTGLSVTAGKTLTVSNTLTLLGTDSSSLNIGAGGTLGTAAYTASTAYQPVATNLTSLAGLTYASASFVKMTGAGTFALDTATYLTSVTGLLATGATTGATSQAQAFTTGVKTSNIFPSTDSTTAFQIRKADGSTSVVNVDTSNSKVFIGGSTVPTAIAHLAAGSTAAGTAPLKFTSGPLNTIAEAGTREYNGDHYMTIALAVRMALGGVLYVSTADSTGTTGTGEQVLGTYTLPAGTLDVNNESIEVAASFSITGANNSTVRIRFGGAAGDVCYQSETANLTGNFIRVLVKIYRTGATTQRAVATASDQLGNLTVRAFYANPTQTLANALAIVATGQNSNTGTRVTLRTFEVRHYGAPA